MCLIRGVSATHPTVGEAEIQHFNSQSQAELFANAMENQFKFPDNLSSSDQIQNSLEWLKDQSQLQNKIFFSPGEV